MWERIGVIVRKEFRQVLRQPRMRMMLFVPPLVQLIIFGYAVILALAVGVVRAILQRFRNTNKIPEIG